MEFKSVLENFKTKLWTYHIKVPLSVARHFLEQGDKRVVCTLNDHLTFQCAIMPAGDDIHFINLNKKIRDELKLKVGQSVSVKLEKDQSTYGLPVPPELQEVLLQDQEGNRLFHALTPGKQRNLIYYAGLVKDPELRLQRALIMMEHLRRNGGKIDFRALFQEFKSGHV
jgi:hypothetical protein